MSLENLEVSNNASSLVDISPLYSNSNKVGKILPTFSECPLRRKHEEELAASGIPQDMWENYITNYTNEDICNYNIGSNTTRTNTGRAAWKNIKQYETYHTGWTYDNYYEFTQFKPDEPKSYTATGKPSTGTIQKYVNPLGVPTDILRARRLPERILKGRTVEQFYADDDAAEVGYITEGAKKGDCMRSLGLLVIALAGINNINIGDEGNKYFNPKIAAFVASKTEVHIVLDEPNKLTSNMGLELSIHLLKKAIQSVNPKCDIKIVCWHPILGKGIDDAIVAGHITLENISRFTYSYYEGIFHLFSNLAPYKTITGERYLELEMVENFSHKFTALKAGKGSGKTEVTAKYINSLPPNTPVIAITHRTKLRKEIAKRLKLASHNDGNKDTSASHRLSICLPSLLEKNIDTERFKGCVVFLDEVKQLFEFLFSECIKHGNEVIQILKEILQNASQIIIADADLDDCTLQALNSFLPEADFLKTLKLFEFVQNTPKMSMQVHKVSNRRVGAAVHDRALECLLAGERILVMVDSQRPTSKLAAENIKRSLEEAYLIKTGERIKGLAVYANRTNKNGHDASRIVKEGIDAIYDPAYQFVVYTTVIGTGISLDKDKHDDQPHFNRVLGGFAGAINLDELLQGLHRYRRLVPREVFLPNKGIATSHAGASYSWRQNLYTTGKKKSEVLSMYSAIVEEIPEQDNAVIRPLENLHCKIRSRLKYECDHYFDVFLQKASVDYDIEVDGKKIGAIIPATLEQAIEDNYSEYSTTVINAKLITNDTIYEELKSKEVMLDKEHDDYTKTNIAKKFDIESAENLINGELLEADKKMGFVSGLRNHYYLDRAHYAESHGQNNIRRDVPDFHKFPKDKNLKTQLLIMLECDKLIASAGESLHKEHDLVKQILATAQKIEVAQPGLIERHLDIRVPKKTDIKYDPMKMIDSLALKFAMRKEGNKRIVLQSGVRVRLSQYFIDDSIRYEIFPIWDENNEVRDLETERKNNESQLFYIQEKLKSCNNAEDKQQLRQDLQANLIYDDQLKTRLIEINDERNLRCKYQRYMPCSQSYEFSSEPTTKYLGDDRPQGIELLAIVREQQINSQASPTRF